MKVYEILSERELRGWAGIFARMIPDSTQKLVAGELESALAWASRRLKGQPIDVASKDLAESWVTASSKSGIPLDDIIALGETEAKKLKISPQVIANAKAQASALRKSADDAAAALARGGVVKQSLTALGSGASQIINWATIWGIAEPIYNCGKKIDRAYELNASGDPDWQGQKLHGAIQFYLDDCVAEVGAIVASRLPSLGLSVFKIPKWFLSPTILNAMAKYTPPGIKNIYQLIANIKPAVEAPFLAWFLSAQGKDWLARFLVSGSFIASPFKFVQETVGGWVKWTYDIVADKLVEPSQQSIPQQPTPYKGPAKLGIDMATGRRIR
jgi:hypothetical protein